MNHNPYRRLAIMAVLHLIAMFVLMYAMVNVFGNAIANLNQFYMAVLMVSAMMLLELRIMRPMYPQQKLNTGITIVAALCLATSFLFIRNQVGIDDEAFLNSMIPHHAGAILMCERASIADEQIQELCANITSGQQAEIDWMKLKLESLAQ